MGPLREAVGVSLRLELDVPLGAAAVKARLQSNHLHACQRKQQRLSMTLRPRPSLRAVGHLHVLVPQVWNSLYECRVDRIHQAAEGLHLGVVGLADGLANPDQGHTAQLGPIRLLIQRTQCTCHRSSPRD